MKPLRAVLMWVLALACAAPVVQAGSPMPVEMKCAVGGKKFTYISTASFSKWGARPDGKPYGSWTFPLPLPECPDNHLVMYREFQRAEIKTLKGLLAGAEYTRLVSGGDTSYYRAYWLMSRLDENALDRAWVLQQASWQADGQLERKARYQREFVELVRSLPAPGPGQDDLPWIAMQFRAVNALRELQRFDEALALLDSLPTKSLDVPIPEEQVSGTTPSGYGKIVENAAEIEAARSRRAWLEYPARQRVIIARHDDSSEPLDMVPLRVAMDLCPTYPRTAPEYHEVCESEAMRTQLERAARLRQSIAVPAPAPTPAPAPAPPAAPPAPN